ncbi:MAG: SRPBCC family protein [Alphaproteobacteria bacterium]
MHGVTNTPSRKDVRRRQLIEATVAEIARRGFARTTLAHVASKAGLSSGIVNFYFTDKDTLLLATLESLADEYTAAWKRAVAGAGPSAADRLAALIEAEFDPEVSRRDKVAAWDAFWAEARARRPYRELCAGLDAEHHETVLELCRRIVAEGGYDGVDAATVARGLTAMTNGLWQELSNDPKRFDREEAKRTCRAFLAGVFPRDFVPPRPERSTAEAGAAAEPRYSAETLPAWTYDNAEFYALEREHIFRRSWQLVGHASEAPEPGDFVTLDVAGERAIVVRGADGVLRAFHNVCRHRASRVVAEERGRCERFFVCPYHGWTYAFDGTLKAVPGERSFPGLKKADYGLRPVDLEVWHGFVFVRFAGSGPGVAEMMAPYAAELEPYRVAGMRPLGREWRKTIDVDWKNVMDNFLEGYHIPVGHPGLYRLFGNNYEVETQAHGVGRAYSWLRDKPSPKWSERHYQKLLPEVEGLPEERRRAWVYYNLFPATTLNVYPDQFSTFVMYPLGPGRTLLRARNYGHADERREMRAARYLNDRINALVQKEDNVLTDRVQGGLASSSYSVGLLSDKELCIRQFHDMVRRVLPVARSPEPPPFGRVAEANREYAAANGGD